MNLQQVHLRISDAATGQPTPVRLRITDAEGKYYAPYGRLTEFASGPNQDVGGNVYLGTKPWAYIDGACEILLPPGKLRVEISKGPEYQPIDTPIELLAGKMSLRLSIQRWSDVRRQGWHAGDSRVHALNTDAALLEGQAEDVAVVNVLAEQSALEDAYGKTLPALSNIISFSGQSFARQTSECGVAVGTHNVHPELGSLGLLHCHRVVFPLTFGGAHGKDDWKLEDWCDQCHRKKGLVVWTNPLHQTPDFLFGEPLADLILGKIDAFEITFFEDSPFDALVEYYRLLAADIVVPLVGGSGKNSNGVAVGSIRTYAHLEPGQTFEYRSWIEAVRAGRTFVSNGPLLFFTINGLTPGTIWQADKPLQVRIEAKSILPFEHLELLCNGEVIAEASPGPMSPYEATLERELPIERSCWLAARCRGAMLLPSRPAPQRAFAHSSVVAVRTAHGPGWASSKAVQGLLNELDRMVLWARQKARCETELERDRLAHVFEEARTALRQKLSS